MAVGHVHYNNKSIHCLDHSGGDNHPERAARCGSHASLTERHLCWHRHWIESATKVRVVTLTFALMARQEDGRFASCDVSELFPRPEMVENRHRHVNIIRIITP